MSKFSERPMQGRPSLPEAILNSVADAPETLELTLEDKAIIDERLEARQRNPDAGSSWEEVYAHITARRR